MTAISQCLSIILPIAQDEPADGIALSNKALADFENSFGDDRREHISALTALAMAFAARAKPSDAKTRVGEQLNAKLALLSGSQPRPGRPVATSA